MTRYEKAAHIIVNQCVKINKDNKILIISTLDLMNISQLIYTSSLKKTQRTFLIQVDSKSLAFGVDRKISHFMRKFDTVFAITNPGICHTTAVAKALRTGTSIISMPNIDKETFSRISHVDFEKNARLAQKLSDILSIGRTARITAPNGTDLIIPINKRKAFADTGLTETPGDFINLPGGEAYIKPDFAKAEGTLVVDSGLGLNGSFDEKINISIKKGRAARITGEKTAENLRKTLTKFGPLSRTVAKLGIGTNQAAKLCGSELEDRKVLGTINIGLGNNKFLGGDVDVPILLEAIVHKATLEIRGKKVLENGLIVLE